MWTGFYRAVEEEPGIQKYHDEKAAELAVWKRMHPWSYDDPPWSPGDIDSQQAGPGETASKDTQFQCGAVTPDLLLPSS